MRIETLQKAVDLSETLNFTETARKFYVTQPALSRQIAKLENELGVAIFDRQQHGVALTKEGAAVIEEARKVLAAYDGLIDIVHSVSGGFKEVLTVGYLIAASRPFLTSSSIIFQSIAPSVNVHYVPMTAREINDAIAHDAVDIAITSSNYTVKDESWKSITIYEDRYSFAMSVRHRLAKNTAVTRDDLYGEQVSIPEEDFNPVEREFVLRALDGIPFTVAPGISTGINDLSFIVSKGQSIMPVLSHVQFYGDPGVVFVPADDALFDKVQIIATWNSANAKQSILPFVDSLLSGAALAQNQRAL